MLSTRGWTKRPREALLQLAIGFRPRMFSVGGSFGANETPPLRCLNSNPVTSQVAKILINPRVCRAQPSGTH